MAYCYEDLGEYTVTPMLVSPTIPERCCEPPLCYPCLPRCTKQIVYCCEKPPSPSKPVRYCEECCQEKPRPAKEARYKQRSNSPSRESCCPTCNNPCKPIKTKYVIPCYRYEDGRIEQYVPTRHGRLPMAAYRRNGIQDQIHGYRGAIRYLCAAGGCKGDDYRVYTAVEPLRKIFPRITQEVSAVKRRKEKK